MMITYGRVEWLCRHRFDTYCHTVLDDNFVNFGVAKEVEIFVDRSGRVDIGMG